MNGDEKKRAKRDLAGWILWSLNAGWLAIRLAEDAIRLWHSL